MNIKYDLIDLVNFGSHARKDVHPSVIVSKNDSLNYPAGDILDANSVVELVNEKLGTVKDILGDESTVEAVQTLIDSVKDNDSATGIIETLAGKADASDVYTKAEVDAAIAAGGSSSTGGGPSTLSCISNFSSSLNENWSITYATREATTNDVIDLNGSEHDASKIAVIEITQDGADVTIVGDIGKDGTAQTNALSKIRALSTKGRLSYDSNTKCATYASYELEHTSPESFGHDDIFMRLPMFWFRSVLTADPEVVQLHFAIDPSVVDDSWNRWNGDTFIATYKASEYSGTLFSQSGVAYVDNKSQTEFKTLARGLGNGYSIITYEAHLIMMLLFCAYYGTGGSQQTLGNGLNYDNSYTPLVASSDTTSSAGQLASPVFWGLKDWWGAVSELVDNLITVGNRRIAIQNYDGSIRRICSSNLVNGRVTKLAFGQHCDVFSIGTVDSSYTDNSGYGSDYFYVGSAGSVAKRSYSDSNSDAGVGFLSVESSPSTSSAYYGSRLQYTGAVVEVSGN